MGNLDFHPIYVNPYYRILMNANFAKDNWNTKTNLPELIVNLRNLGNTLKEEDLITMLNANWRPSKVAAWIIGLSQKVHLETVLHIKILQSPVYCEHIIFGLCLLNTNQSINIIQDFLQTEMEKILKDFDFLEALFEIDKISFTWALAGISYLDSINQTNHLKELTAKNGAWTNFKEYLQKQCHNKSSKSKNSENRNSKLLTQILAFEKKEQHFKKAMEMIKQVSK